MWLHNNGALNCSGFLSAGFPWHQGKLWICACLLCTFLVCRLYIYLLCMWTLTVHYGLMHIEPGWCEKAKYHIIMADQKERTASRMVLHSCEDQHNYDRSLTAMTKCSSVKVKKSINKLEPLNKPLWNCEDQSRRTHTNTRTHKQTPIQSSACPAKPCAVLYNGAPSLHFDPSICNAFFTIVLTTSAFHPAFSPGC